VANDYVVSVNLRRARWQLK